MKRLFLALFIKLFSVFSSYGQEPETIFIDSFYQDKTEYLIKSEIITLDSIPATELLKRVKNWGGTNFVNLKEVLVSETEDQLVFNYVTKSFYVSTFLGSVSYSWYVRLVAQFKDGKVRLLFYDDGNCFIPASYSNGVTIPATAARSSHLSGYFRKMNGTLATKQSTPGLINFKNDIENTSSSILKGIKNPIQIKEIKNDGW